jgi:hypothetical protein
MRFRMSNFSVLPLAIFLAVIAGCFGRSPTAPALDTLPPTVSSTNPVNGAVGGTVITASFSEPMEASTLTTATFEVNGPNGAPVAGTVAYDAPTEMARFMPDVGLAANTIYTATITTGATDLAGNALANSHVWTFTSAAASGDRRLPPRSS